MRNINNKTRRTFSCVQKKINYNSIVKNFLDEVSLHEYRSREHKHKSIDKQFTMLLAVYFAPSNNAEDVFLKDEKDESFFSKYSVSSSLFPEF